ncbi:nucleopolyhedrovirus P10 family protein [Streptomyces sp. GbtcB6]|uniref:nucleopolyhedrovirus P10 family protein n=1 Tax=Streptomyces sp. GbtcB6 TaxID=2824751 RepID=UPI001C300570|nr:nucleopolyhedrovirus P10 family protein [Streptomyces sp. GbtcB6]
MTADRRTHTVRHPLGFGRLLPLGGPRDGAWLAETAADAVLRRAAAEVAGVRLGAVRIALADPADVAEAGVPSPPGAVPPGALRLSADFAATAAEPLPATAARLRRALAAATVRLGLAVTEVDLRVTDLLEEEPAAQEAVRAPRPPSVREGADPEGARVTAAALAVPGVARVTGALSREIHVDAALPRRHVRVEVALTDGPRAVEVARRVRAAVGEALADRPTVALVVTAVE